MDLVDNKNKFPFPGIGNPNQKTREFTIFGIMNEEKINSW